MSFFGDIGVATRNGLKRMVDARERQVSAYVHATMVNLDEDTLAKAGYTRDEVKRKAGAYYPL